MRAIIGYNYALDQWQIWTICVIRVDGPGSLFGGLCQTAKEIKRCLTNHGKYLHPEIIEIDLKSFNYSGGRYSVEFADDDFEFPEVLTLEQSIAKNKKFLQSIVRG